MAVKKYFFYQNDSAGINRLVDLNDEQQFWRKHSYRRLSIMKGARQENNQEERWKAWQRQYEAWRPPKGLDWQSNIVPPFTTSVVESALSEQVDQNLMPVIGARTREDVPKATVLNFANKYIWDVGYGSVELYKAQKQQLILGTTFWQEYYLQQKQKVEVLTKFNPKTGKEEFEEVEMLDFDDCYGEAVNLWDLWWDPNARAVNVGPHRAQDVIRRNIIHIDNFKNTFVGSRWDKFNLARFVKPGGDTNYYEFYKPSLGTDHGSQVEVLWHWIRQPDRLVITANDIPFFIGPKPYNHKRLPFARGVDLLNPWSIYGKGEPQLLESIQDELTTMRRMRLDRQKMDIYKMIFISNRETLSAQDLIPAPMKPVYVDEIENVKEFAHSDINPSAYREEVLLKEDGTRVTGVDDAAQSVGRQASTATESAILKEATLKRLRTKIWLTSRILLTGLLELRVPNIIQFYSVPKIRQIMGKDAIDKWNKIKQADMEGRLLQQGTQFFEQEFRTIKTKNKKLQKLQNGEIQILDERGDHFFMITPDVLVPKKAFTYELSGQPTVPLSKPLLQQKVNELFASPVMIAAMERGHIDVAKVADKMLEINDFDRDDFVSLEAKQQTPQEEPLIDPERMMAHAARENEVMIGGQQLPGTPFATSEHTLTHLEFMKSDPFKRKADAEIIGNFSEHIQWEFAAQRLRSKGVSQGNQARMGQPAQLQAGDMRTKETQGIQRGNMKNTLPGKQVGPENVPDVGGMAGFGPGR